MNKAFIFDMDGVIIDSERVWTVYEEEFKKNLFGKKVAEKIGATIGMSLPAIYDLAVSYGMSLDRENFHKQYHEKAKIVYSEATITHGFEEFLLQLRELKFKIGLVSASPMSWIELTLAKINAKDRFDYILSLHEREDLKHKPSPDGYLQAMRYLQSLPETTIILEDSNRGLQSAKSSGAFTIGFRELLITEYHQIGADIYADSLKDVIKIVMEKFPQQTL